MKPTTGPLRISSRNPRYFEDATGRIRVLTGAHTWNNQQDMGPRGKVVPFDWPGYLEMLASHGHNSIRLWAFDSIGTWNPADEVATIPWQRVGTEMAFDGRPQVDLLAPDPAYYTRLRDRVSSAAEAGVYVSVMLFECWSNFAQNETPLAAHLFALGNNVNGIDILASQKHGVHDGWSGLTDPDVLAIQERHIADCVAALAGQNNVLWEICNEGGPSSHDWQDHLTGVLRRLLAENGAQHMIGQTGGMRTLNSRLHASETDWISPDANALDELSCGYRTAHYTWGQGPSETGDRPLIVDTDHVWGVGGSVAWVWKTFLRGYNLWYMDPFTDRKDGFFRHPRWQIASDPGIRRAMGTARSLIERLDLAQASPASDRASTGHCMAQADRALIVFDPEGVPFTVQLGAGRWQAEWRHPDAAHDAPPDVTSTVLTRAGTTEFVAPWAGPSVLTLTAA